MRDISILIQINQSAMSAALLAGLWYFSPDTILGWLIAIIVTEIAWWLNSPGHSIRLTAPWRFFVALMYVLMRSLASAALIWHVYAITG